jgi:hypothetical protein
MASVSVALCGSNLRSDLSLLPTFSLETLDFVEHVVGVFGHLCSFAAGRIWKFAGHLLPA